MDTFTLSTVAEFGVWFVVFLFSSTLHEAAHALAARLGGDDTAYEGGQVTLNPLPHIRREPFGMILVPIASFFFAGWMMGWASTPYDPAWAERYPRRQAAMSAAGPLANLLIAVSAFCVLFSMIGAGVLVAPAELTFSHLAEPAARFGQDTLLNPLTAALSVAMSLNLLLFLFNLMPIPPLDGSGIVHGLFPGSAGRLVEAVRRNPMLSMIGLLVAWRVFPFAFRPVFALARNLLHPGMYGM
ncbi:MAG TPA: site-2 protease family protein [Patescibacteria group bacterium]|nr:site-2 protease family protein [Patescibacteria group bacterium]